MQEAPRAALVREVALATAERHSLTAAAEAAAGMAAALLPEERLAETMTRAEAADPPICPAMAVVP